MTGTRPLETATAATQALTITGPRDGTETVELGLHPQVIRDIRDLAAASAKTPERWMLDALGAEVNRQRHPHLQVTGWECEHQAVSAAPPLGEVRCGFGCTMTPRYE